MPYIEQSEREALDPSLTWLIRDLKTDGFTDGMLNYAISRLANAYIEHHGLRYTNICDVQGVLHGALDEFNERVARPYEAIKESENGTVWTCNPPLEVIQERSYPPWPGEVPMMVNRLTAAVFGDKDEPLDLPDEVVDEGPPRQTWLKCRHEQCDLHVAGGKPNCSGYCLDDDEMNDI